MEVTLMRWWNRLDAKLAALIASVLLVSTAVFLAVEIRGRDRQLLGEMQRSARLLGETAASGIHNAMLTGDPGETRKILERIGSQESVEAVRLYSKDRVAFSTQREENGLRAERRGPACAACHASEAPLAAVPGGIFSRVHRSSGGARSLSVMKVLFNESSCSAAACHVHPASQRVLGVVSLELSLAEVDRANQALLRGSLLFAGLSAVILGALGFLFVRSLVRRPLRELLDGVARVAEGNLDERVEERSDDEMGVLSRGFNAMTAALRAARDHQRQLTERLTQSNGDLAEAVRVLQETQLRLVHAEKLATAGRLAAAMAHEVNNPLACVQANLQALRAYTVEIEVLWKSAQSAAEQLARSAEREEVRSALTLLGASEALNHEGVRDIAQAVEESIESAGRIAALVSSFRSLASPAQPELERRRCDLHQLARGCADAAVSMGAVALEPAQAEVFAEASPEAVRAALSSVLGFLRHRCAEVALRIEVRGEPEAGLCVVAPSLELSDEERRRIFDPRISDRGSKEMHADLELTLAYQIAKRSGADLSVESLDGAGTAFVLALNVDAAIEGAARRAASGA